LRGDLLGPLAAPLLERGKYFDQLRVELEEFVSYKPIPALLKYGFILIFKKIEGGNLALE